LQAHLHLMQDCLQLHYSCSCSGQVRGTAAAY
jgi:hypothetical protein